MTVNRIAAIVIGRNEGERLVQCLNSLRDGASPVIYVDSGSNDGSVEMALARGVEVVRLDMTRPFTAARARNAGLARLNELGGAEYVQMVDGDCQVDGNWIRTAVDFLNGNPDVAVVCGRRRERDPQGSIYNAHCNREWDTPVGLADSCGGDALMRVAAITEIGGYNPDLIAGEEPEMCVRLRQSEWRIWRLDAEMTLHDAAMMRFGQFWKRARRAGHAFAEGAYMHGALPERHYVAQTKRAVIWGGVIPVLILVAALLFGPWALAAFAIYPLQVVRLARQAGFDSAAWQHAVLLTAGKFAETVGITEFHWRRLCGKRSALIEYK